MSRSGYSEDWDFDQWAHIRWRGAVTSAFRGKRGQAFLKEAIAALDALPEKRLLKNSLVGEFLSAPEGTEGEPAEAVCGYCTLGAVGAKRGLDMKDYDEGTDPRDVASLLEVPLAIASEIMWENDEGRRRETPEQRWQRMRAWLVSHINDPTTRATYQQEASDADV